MKKLSEKELQRKLKIERVEMCLNCQRFTECDDIGQIDDCKKFLEVEQDEAVIIVGLEEYAALELRRSCK